MMEENALPILIFDDEIARSRRFLPLCYTRCVAELRSGYYTGVERVKRLYPHAQIYLHTAPGLKDVVAKRYGLPVNELPEGALQLVNSRALLLDSVTMKEVNSSEVQHAVIAGEPLTMPDLQIESAPTSLWDIVHRNPQRISDDVKLVRIGGFPRIDPSSLPNSAVEKKENLFIHKHAKIGAYTVFDCSEGPIVVDEGAHIMPQTTIIGPAIIGKKSIVKVGSKIYGGTTIGPVCKVGGEIENSIVQGYANKQHDGYLGHSFVGEWCNLGAGTNTSDLKNDYSPVRVTIEGEEFNTNSLFVGLMMGDHSKSGIGTQFNTGSVVGVSCNVFNAGFPSKWIPNFSWGGASGLSQYRFDKAIQVAKAVMQRRNVIMSSEEEALLRRLYDARFSIEI